jgi:sulfite reductase (NADPH) hemoprotein beta-component
MVRNAAGEPGFEVIVGGGLGRTPMIGVTVRDFLPEADLLPYVEAILSVYNTLGPPRQQVQGPHQDHRARDRGRGNHPDGRGRFAELRPLFGGNDQKLLAEIRQAFAPPAFRNAPVDAYDAFYKADPTFRAWADTNLTRHRNAQYAIVTISLKAHGANPGRRDLGPDAPDR